MNLWQWFRGLFGKRPVVRPGSAASPPLRDDKATPHLDLRAQDKAATRVTPPPPEATAPAEPAEPSEPPKRPIAPAPDPQAVPPPAPPRLAAAPGVPSKPVSQAPPIPRHLHLGVDFGTCWSKLVLRDYEAREDRCFVVQPDERFGSNGDYRIPSAVVIHERSLWFGWQGQVRAQQPHAIVIHSPKMRAAFGERAVANPVPLPVGATAEDLAALVVAYLLEIGRCAAEEYVTWLPGRFNPQITMTIGAPMSLLDSHELRPKFLRIARTGFELFRSLPRSVLDGMLIEDGIQAVRCARARVADKAVAEPREWVRSEAEAGLLWMFCSAAVPEGLYSCIDVGAGTTDVSFFRIVSRPIDGTWQKHGMVFFSGESDPPGVDALDEVLVANGLGDSVPAVRGTEAELIQGLNGSALATVRSIVDSSFSIYRRAFSSGYRKHVSQSAWENYGLFTLGGGNKLPCFKDAFRAKVWEQLNHPRLMDAGHPVDLYEWRRDLQPFRGDASFLLVAYGLSFQDFDTPPTDAPHEVPPFNPLRERKRPLDPDEYWSG